MVGVTGGAGAMDALVSELGPKRIRSSAAANRRGVAIIMWGWCVSIKITIEGVLTERALDATIEEYGYTIRRQKWSAHPRP